GFTPEWVKSWKDPHEPENDYILANDMATLVWMANYTAIEIHPRLARVNDPDHPDNVMIDLDPAEGATWDDVKEVARVVKQVLDDLHLEGFPKTTGSRGIHVLVPIVLRYTFDETRAFALRVVELAPGYGGDDRQPILRALAARLAKDGIAARAVTFSTRGSRPSRAYERELADLRGARERLREEGAERIALVGRSFGGRMCAFLARAEPPDALAILGHP